MRKNARKPRIVLSRETLHALDSQRLQSAAGGITANPAGCGQGTDACTNPCTFANTHCCA